VKETPRTKKKGKNAEEVLCMWGSSGGDGKNEKKKGGKVGDRKMEDKIKLKRRKKKGLEEKEVMWNVEENQRAQGHRKRKME